MEKKRLKKETNITSEFDLQKALEPFKTKTCKHCSGAGNCSCDNCQTSVKCPICGLANNITVADRQKEAIECEAFRKVEDPTHAFSTNALPPLGRCTWCEGSGKAFSSIHASLIEGMKMVARRQEVQEGTPLEDSVDDMYCWVDDLIKEQLGGKRAGLKIVWMLPSGSFEFDPFSETLVGPT